MEDIELFKDIYKDLDDLTIDEKKEEIVKKSRIEKNKFTFFNDKSYIVILNEYNLCKKKNDFSLELKNNNICNWIVNFNNIKIELVFEQNLYPYYPPYMKLIKPKFKNIKDIIDIDILKNSVWKSTFYMNDVIMNIKKYIESKGIIDSNLEYSDLDNNLIRLPLIINNKQKNFTNNINNKKYWNKGVGYGTNDSNDWNIDLYILGEEIRNTFIIDILNNIFTIEIIDNNIKKLKENNFFNIIQNYLNTTLLDIDKNVDLYKIIFKIIYKFIDYFDISFYEKLYPLYIDSKELLKIKNIDNTFIAKEIIKIYETKKYNISESKEDDINYINELKDERFKFTNIHKNNNIKKYTLKNNNQPIKKIGKELISLNKNLPLTESSSIFFRADENESYITQFIITGPKNTPYSNGCFLFTMIIPSSYPNKPPVCMLETTGHNKVRFNANLYECGKVCLSLLGTWNGRQSESWNPKSSTLLQILVSIQSLIFNEQPYFNEPGWEKELGSNEGSKKSKIYNYQIRLNTMKWAILEQLKNPNKNFENVIKKHFFLKKDIILKECLKWVEEYEEKDFYNVYNDHSLDWVNNKEIKKEYNTIYNEIYNLLSNINF